jgi:hypothetical protein
MIFYGILKQGFVKPNKRPLLCFPLIFNMGESTLQGEQLGYFHYMY